MTLHLIYGHDNFGAPIAKTNDNRYQLVALYLSSDIQTITICDLELKWITNYENGDNKNTIAGGNLTRRELEDDIVKFHFMFDSSDEVDPEVVPITDIKQILLEWRTHLQKSSRKKRQS